MGEVIKNIRTIVIPQHDDQTYTTEWQYDTWNRLEAMTYADGETVTYHYNTGGLLESMSGKKQADKYDYVTQLGYDKFEQRVLLTYGNGTKTTYQYEPKRRRLSNMTAKTAAGRAMMDNSYGYDAVNNILSLKNNAEVPNSNLMGGSSEYSYEYDDLYRLTSAEGSFTGSNHEHRYNLEMKYNSVGSSLEKAQLHERKGSNGDNTWNTQKKTSYSQSYEYAASQPHAPIHIGEQKYSYDKNGNQTGWTHDVSGQRRQIVWDSLSRIIGKENRIRAIADNGSVQHYIYDASGTRVLKGKSKGQSIYVNSEYKAGSGNMGNYTVYVNPYLVLRSGGYTKHYYIEGQRIVSKLGSGLDNNGKGQLKAGQDKVNYGKKQADIREGIVKNLKFLGIDGAILTAGNSGKTPPGQLKGGKGGSAGGGKDKASEKLQYFYHPDHLGSSSYITDASGEVYQHLEYFAFGETFVEEHSNTKHTPYLFNGKELDEETGLYYYGARYYDARTSIWLAVDPLTEEMPAWSPYNYSFDNPIKFIDPDGQKPTPAEAARMAAHVYGDKTDNVLTGGWQVSQRDFGIQLQNKNGLKSLVYERVVDGKITEYTYATAGTEDWTDWNNNGQQPLGLSDQYESASDNAKIISAALGETELTFTGHSLGGGEAALNALVTDREAITFNAAGVGDITKFNEGNWKTPFKSEKGIDAYFLRTDPLNTLQNNSPMMPDVNGNRHPMWPKDLPSTYNGHSIDNIIKNFGVDNPENFIK